MEGWDSDSDQSWSRKRPAENSLSFSAPVARIIHGSLTVVWWTADVPRQERHELPCTERGPAHLSKFDTRKRLTLMNLRLLRGDRVAECSWLNPPTPGLSANSLALKSEKTKKIHHHTVFHAFSYARLNYTAAISVFIHYCCWVSVSVLMWKSAEWTGFCDCLLLPSNWN